ncbi:MAG TPA: response regulator transcription factor [Acidimicrobiales bacterium]
MTVVRVLVVDDNAVIRMGLVSLLETSGNISVVGEAANGREAITRAAETRPDVVLLDVRMPVMDGLAAAPSLAQQCKVLMLTYAEDTDIIETAIRAGASGYLIHGRFDAAELVDAVLGTVKGASFLSPAAASVLVHAMRRGPEMIERDPAASGLSDREFEVMDLIARGKSNAEIARQLFLSEKTVKNHVNRIYAKLGVKTRGEAIATWLGVAQSGPSA